MSEIITDKLTGKTSAGDVTITSEGGSATMQLQQGVAKSWVNFDGSLSTLSPRDSLNVSGLLDNTTGDYDVNFTSSMDNSNYFTGGSSTDSAVYVINYITGSDRSTTDVRIRTLYAANFSGAGTISDASDVCLQVLGDLA
jgi:hypothetical protein